MPPRGYISEKVMKRSEELRKPIVCACGCDEKVEIKAYHFWPGRSLPKFKPGHQARVLDLAPYGMRHSESAKERISKASAERWESEDYRAKLTMKMSAINKGTAKRKASGRAALNPNHGKNISAAQLVQYASGRTPVNGCRNFKCRWLKTKKAGEVYCSSSWEVERCKTLDRDGNVVSFEKNVPRIPYLLNGIKRSYFPDFLVKRRGGISIVEEVKGHIWAEEEWLAKKRAAKKFCKKEGMEFSVLDSLLLIRQKGGQKF